MNKPVTDVESETGRPTWAGALSIIIPAYNEENGVTATLEKLLAAIPESEIIVVDDCSTDQTAERVRAFPKVQLIRHSFNRGYGAALKTGMKAATGDYIAWFDADNEHRAEDLVAMAERMDKEHVAAVIGVRVNPMPSIVRSMGKMAIRMLARSMNIYGARDMNCGLRVLRREVIMRYLPLLPNRYSASLTSTMVMIERRYPVVFHQVQLNPRLGSSKVALGDGFAALMLVLRMVMLFAPLRIFFRTGALLVVAGILYGIPVTLIDGGGVPAAAAVLLIVGMMLCMLGLIADQISQLRLNQLDASAAPTDLVAEKKREKRGG